MFQEAKGNIFSFINLNNITETFHNRKYSEFPIFERKHGHVLGKNIKNMSIKWNQSKTYKIQTYTAHKTENDSRNKKMKDFKSAGFVVVMLSQH